jgi:hypothetical protein
MSVDCSDGEPLAYYRETPRTAHKQHECSACEIPILPGHKYWVIAACWDGSVHGWKRCDRCQLIHVQLRPLCAARDEWPDEALNCGHEFEEVNGRAPPDWLAALAFWRPGDPLPATNRCTPEPNRYEYAGPLLACWGSPREWNPATAHCRAGRFDWQRQPQPSGHTEVCS